MNNKVLLFIWLLYSSTTSNSQERPPYFFGDITQREYNLKVYEKDSTANAVFLFEFGRSNFARSNNSIVILTRYYAKVKIFNKEGMQNATIKIPIKNNQKESEKVFGIKAITHNGRIRKGLNPKNIFVSRINSNLAEVKFTMPDIKENSIIEYEYTLESPFYFNFKGWEFQSHIPKIYSEFYAVIPGNYRYNRSLRGYQKLSKNIVNVVRKCFYISRYISPADCEELIYAMEDVPAFIEEDYLNSKSNYLSAIKFELSENVAFYKSKKKYSKNWKSVDKEFRTGESIGKQLKKVNEFEKILPPELYTGENNLTKAKKIFYHITDHITWNERVNLFSAVDAKKAYIDKVGNSTEINIALINALNSAGFDAHVVLLSTRSNGLPTKIHPVLSEFNYAIAKLDIDNKSYLLDATDKNLPFNLLPFKTLNSYGRVMDFKKGSYWYPIDVKNHYTRTSLKLKMDDSGNFKGQMQKSFDGYKAVAKRLSIDKLDREEYLTKAEEEYGTDDNLVINSYKNSDVENIEKPLKELFDITIENEPSGDLIIFNPFIDGESRVNPFKLNQRLYPVDFGHATTTLFNLQLIIPESYKVKSLPERKAIKLPNDGGLFTFSIVEKNNKIQMTFKVIIKRALYDPKEYPYLKEFFKQIIKTQKSLITLEKK